MKKITAAFANAAAALALSAGAMIAPASNAEAQEDRRTVIITYQHPASVTLMPGGQRNRQIDCGELQTVPGSADPHALYAPCEWFEQLDPNGQNFCDATDKLTSSSSITERVNALSLATLQAITHAADFHGDCKAQAGSLEQRRGRNPAAKYGSDWKNLNSCSITGARDQCREALGLDHTPTH